MPHKLLRKLFLRIFRKLRQIYNTGVISFKMCLINDSNSADHFLKHLNQIINKKNSRKLQQLTKLWPDFSAQKSALVINKCIESQSYDILNYLLSQHLIQMDTTLDQYGWTPFHRAVYNKDIELIVLLIRNEANIDIKDINGNTPLHILLQSWTQHNIPDKSTPDLGPESHYSVIILKLLLNYCKSQRIDVINRRNSFGKTPLHYAVVNMGANDMVLMSLLSLLLENGADPDSRDRLNRTPLFSAINERSFPNHIKKQIVDKLIESNCDPLNTYELRQFGTGFTLKQLSRSYLLSNSFLLDHYLLNSLPKELNSYLNIKLIAIKKKSIK